MVKLIKALFEDIVHNRTAANTISKKCRRKGCNITFVPPLYALVPLVLEVQKFIRVRVRPYLFG